MTCLLITGIGGDIAQGIAAILRESITGVRIYGTDTHDEHGGALYCDGYTTVPKATDPRWLHSIESLRTRCGADIIIPTTEAELLALSTTSQPVDPTRWLMVQPGALHTCLDKLSTARALASIGLRAPWTIDAALEIPCCFPCVLKPRRGSGSKEVRIISDSEEARLFALRAPDSIFQELLLPPDREVTCAVYREGPGQTWVIQLRRRLVGGFTGWAEVINEPAIAETCFRIAEGLDIVGCINVQMRITVYGPCVFEINPRISSTALMRHLLGFQDVLWNINRMLGRERAPRHVETGQRAVRIQSAAVLPTPLQSSSE